MSPCFECSFCLRYFTIFISFRHLYYSCLHVPFSITNKNNIPLSKAYTKTPHKFWGTKHIYQTICPPTGSNPIPTHQNLKPGVIAHMRILSIVCLKIIHIRKNYLMPYNSRPKKKNYWIRMLKTVIIMKHLEMNQIFSLNNP